MTKTELQAYADQHGIVGIDAAAQTKTEMVRLIRRRR